MCRLALVKCQNNEKELLLRIWEYVWLIFYFVSIALKLYD